jgi:hypothetical protein
MISSATGFRRIHALGFAATIRTAALAGDRCRPLRQAAAQTSGKLVHKQKEEPFGSPFLSDAPIFS